MFFLHSKHVVSVVFDNWEDAGSEVSEFVDNPTSWIAGHYQTVDDNGVPLSNGPTFFIPSGVNFTLIDSPINRP